MNGKKILYGAMIGLIALTGAGCGTQQADTSTNSGGTTANSGGTSSNAANNSSASNNNAHAEHQQHLANGDIQETTASLDILPSFLDKADPKIKEAYQIAAKNLSTIEYMPCYCGCGVSAGHKNNMQCFVKEVKPGGEVVWDDHGTRCGTCMNIAVTSAKLVESGKSLKEVRTIIDNQYKEGYAKPTPTPMPF